MAQVFPRVRMGLLESHVIVFPAQTFLDQLLTNRYEVSDRPRLWQEFPVTSEFSGTAVTIDLLECHPAGCSTAEVLSQLGKLKLTPATLAHVLFILREDHNLIARCSPVLCLGSIWTDPTAVQHTPLIWDTGSTISLSLFALEEEWWDPCMIFALRS